MSNCLERAENRILPERFGSGGGVDTAESEMCKVGESGLTHPKETAPEPAIAPGQRGEGDAERC